MCKKNRIHVFNSLDPSSWQRTGSVHLTLNPQLFLKETHSLKQKLSFSSLRKKMWPVHINGAPAANNRYWKANHQIARKDLLVSYQQWEQVSRCSSTSRNKSHPIVSRSGTSLTVLYQKRNKSHGSVPVAGISLTLLYQKHE